MAGHHRRWDQGQPRVGYEGAGSGNLRPPCSGDDLGSGFLFSGIE